MAARLGQDALARIDQNDRQVGGGRAGGHVARVLLVARRVGDDELAPRRGEVAIGDVDGDALLALGAQAVGEQREIDRRRRRFAAAALGDGAHMIFVDIAASRRAAARSASTCRRPRCPRC